MAVTNEQISEYLAANPGLSDAEIAAAMAQHKVTPEQMAQVTGLGQDVVQARYDAAKPSPLAQVANTGMGAQDTAANAATGALTQATSSSSAAPAYDFSTSLGQYKAIKSGDKDLIAQALAANTGNDVYDRSFLTSVLGKEFADSYFAPPVSDVARLPTETTTAGALTQAADNTANNVLSGVILAGDSWLSGDANTNTIASQIGQGVTNVAVGGSTTADTLNQLNSFVDSGGTFAPGSTVMLDIGGNDLLQGTSAESVRDNLNQIVTTLAGLGVNVVLSGAPAVGSVADVTGSTNLAMSNIFNDVATNNSNVTLVDSMSGLLNQKDLIDDTGFHLTEAGRTAFNAALSNAYLNSQGKSPTEYTDQAIRDFAAEHGLTLDQATRLAPSFGLTAEQVTNALASGQTSDLSDAEVITQSADEAGVDPYVYAYEYGVANNDFTALASLLAATPDSTALVSKYNLTPEQINQIEFGTGFDLDQSGGYGAGVVGNNWDYNEYLDKLRAGDADSLNEALGSFATLNPLAANNVQNMFGELVQQQTVTGDNWSAGNLGSKEAAAMDFALRLAENNVGSIYDLGQRTIERIEETEGGPQVIREVEYYNKKTGEALPDWDRVASAPNSGSRLTYNLNFAEDGTPIPYTTRNRSDWLEFREGFVKPALSIVALANPALAPYIAAGNAINAADKGDWGSAVVSALTAATGFSGNLNLSASTVETLNQAKTGAQILNAIDKGNPIAIANALAQTETGQTLLGSDMGNGITLGDVINTAKVAASVSSGDYTAALDYASSLTGNPNLKVAASSVNLLNAIQTGDPFKIITAMGQLDKTVKANTRESDQGGITNRVVDDSIPQGDVSMDAGANAFIDAKRADMSDEDAMAAADAASGVLINKIPDSESGNVVTTTYDDSALADEFGNLQGAIETNAMDDAVRADELNVISSLPKFADAYSQARTLLGPNQTFTWNGKEYSTATAAERPDLSAPKVEAATDESAAETARLNRLNTELVTGNAPDQSAAETTRLANLNAGLKSMEKTGFLGQIYKDLNEQFRLQGVAANEYLANNPDSPITNNISTAFEAAGNLQKNVAGGVALLLDDKPLADALVAGGDKLTQLGQSIGTGPQDTKNWEDTVDLVSKANGFEKVAVIAGRILDGTSGLGRQVEIELRQELPGMFLGGGSVKGILLATGAMDTAETAGNAALDTYDEEIKKGASHEEALSSARTAGAVAGMTEAAVQLTLGKAADVIVGKIGNVAGKAGTKIAGEGVVEGGQEAGASVAVDLALGNAVDVNSALTQGVLGAAVGKGAATATSGVDAAQTDASTSGGTTGATATDLGTVGATVPGADVVQGANLGSIGSVTPGADAVVGGVSTLGDAGAATISVADAEQAMADLGLNVSGDAAVSLATNIQNAADSAGAAGSVAGSAADISNIITTQLGSGADAAVVIGSTITGAVNSGADIGNVINSTVTSSLNAGANASVVIDSAITSGITGGADASVVIGNTVTSAVNSGANVAATVESSVSSAITAGADASIAVGSSVTSVVNSGGNVTTAVDSAVTAAVNAGSNVTTAVESAVTAAVTAGASVDASVAAAVSSAVNSGANVATVVDAATTAATATGNNVTVASDANVVTISNATTNTTTTVDTTTGVTTSVDSANNVTTVVDGNTSTVVDANANTTSQTTVDANNNTQTTVTVDSNNNSSTETVVDNNTNITTSVTVDANSTTQTTIDANNNTQTTVLTNTDTNTQTTVKVNTDTGDVIEVKETEVPTDWKPPVIDEPKVPEVPVVKTPEDPTKPAAPKLPSLKGSEEQRGGGGFGLPSGINVDTASLRSQVTGGAIDPLARVKQAQAELERDVMMNQLDPRFAAVIQQRTDPQQQAQQYDKDIGALAKLLSGEPSAPANEGKYYSYGSEDSIDSILGGKAANYKEGGFVEPLKASGGMVLPLLAKSGGALGKYSGREDFKGGKHVAGDGDGQSDDIPAWLADGEFVFPADVVSALGNGSTKAGTDKLYAMMHGIRDRARSKGPKDLPPPAFKSPLDYLKSSKRSK